MPNASGSAITIASRIRKLVRQRFMALLAELQREVNGRLVAPVHAAEVGVGRDQTDLIAHTLGDLGRLRVVEQDALLPVEQTVVVPDFGDDGVDAEHRDAVAQRPELGTLRNRITMFGINAIVM